MASRLVLLGTGTCRLDDGRSASAALLEIGDLRLVYDFGRGIAARLGRVGLRQDDVEHVVLSHYHPDHFSDLIPYLHAGLWSPTDSRSRDLHVYGPPGLEEVMSRILRLVGFPGPDEEPPFRVELHETGQETLRIAGVELDYVHLPPAGNRGLRFSRGGRIFALTGDAEFHAREVEFLRGAELAVVDSGHLSDEEIVRLAVESAARLLVCSHLYREPDVGELTARAGKEGFAGRITLARELQAFEL